MKNSKKSFKNGDKERQTSEVKTKKKTNGWNA